MKVLLVLLAVLAPVAGAQTFEWALIEGNLIEPEGFSFIVGDQQCSVTKAGRGECLRSGVAHWRLRIPVDDGRIERLAIGSIDDSIVLAYQLTDEEGVWGKLVRLRGQRVKWQRNIGGLNLALPVARNGDAFVAALTYVARVDLRDGSFKWRLERAYGGGYESSELVLSDDQLIVTSQDITTRKVKHECLAVITGRPEPCAKLK